MHYSCHNIAFCVVELNLILIRSIYTHPKSAIGFFKTKKA